MFYCLKCYCVVCLLCEEIKLVFKMNFVVVVIDD